MMEEISNIDLICNRDTAVFWGTVFFWLPVAWTAGQRLFPDGIWAGNLTLLLPVPLFLLLRVFDTV